MNKNRRRLRRSNEEPNYITKQIDYPFSNLMLKIIKKFIRKIIYVDEIEE